MMKNTLFAAVLTFSAAAFATGSWQDLTPIGGVELDPSGWTREALAARIAGLLATYFVQGGQCLHINCFDAKTLRDDESQER